MLDSVKDKARSFLFGRKRAYEITFNGVQADEVLADLAKFCRATESTFHTDPRVAAVMEGRREVWLRIMHHLKLTNEQIWDRYGRN